MPSSTLAATIQPQLGATAISSGTGSAIAQPAISSRRRPTRSAPAPAPRLVSALASPKATMNDSTAALEARPKSLAADERQRRALEPDHRADERVDRDQQRELRERSRAARAGRGAAVTRCGRAAGRRGWRRRSRPAAAGAGGMSSSSASTNASSESKLQRAVVAALEADRRDRVGRQAASADRARVVRGVEEQVIGERQQPLGQRAIQRARHLLDACARRARAGRAGRRRRRAARRR